MCTTLSSKGIEGAFGIPITFDALNPRSASSPASILQSSRMLGFRTSMVWMLSLTQCNYWGIEVGRWLAVMSVLATLIVMDFLGLTLCLD